MHRETMTANPTTSEPTTRPTTSPTPGGRTLAGRTGAALAIGALALLGVVALALWPREGAGGAYAAPGIVQGTPMPAEGVVREAHVVVPAVLESVYEAFALGEEGAIYDRLASVAANDALESLYLERAGALATGGLPDQVVHELRLMRWNGAPEPDRATIDATWHVLGEVGHAEHTHVRGNAYSATLTLEPVEGAWRLTGFELTDVDRTDAGTLTTVPGADDGAAAVTG